MNLPFFSGHIVPWDPTEVCLPPGVRRYARRVTDKGCGYHINFDKSNNKEVPYERPYSVLVACSGSEGLALARGRGCFIEGSEHAKSQIQSIL